MQGTVRVRHVPTQAPPIQPFYTGIANKKPRVLIYIERTTSRARVE